MNRIKISQSLIILDGMTGAGKTTATTNLSERISRLAVVGMDKIKCNISDFERGERDNGIAKKAVYAMTKIYLEEGLSVCVEQPVKSTDELNSYKSLSTEFSIPIYEFQLIADPETAFSRVKARQEGNPPKLQVSDERIRRNIKIAQSKQDWGFTVIDTTNIDPSNVLDKIINILN